MTCTHPLIHTLFHQNRTLLGEGFDASLHAIDRYLQGRAGLTVHKIPSGTACGTWTILPEWRVVKATLRDEQGKTLCDYEKNPHALWHYSKAVSGTLTRDELSKHLAIGPAPEMLPSVVAYYSDSWGFSLCPEQWRSTQSERFEVDIQTTFHEGALSIGEVFIQGQVRETLLIDAVLSFPALANNLTGAGLAADLIKYLKEREPYYSYRILFTPETIGPIAAHYHVPQLFEHVVGGFTMLNLGRGEGFHYKMSRQGESPVDHAVAYMSKQHTANISIMEYNVITGETGNEKAYNSLGIEVPIGRLCSATAGSYIEYDTSADNLNFISDEKLRASSDFLKSLCEAIEATVPLSHLFEGEPFLSGFQIFQTIKTERDRQAFDSLMAFSDGTHSLISIAEKIGVTVEDLRPAAELMMKKNLICKR